MQKLNYPLKKYRKAVEDIAEQNGLSHVNVVPNGGSVVRFELFEKDSKIPCTFWVIHHSHNHKKEIWSKDDYRKASVNLNCSYEDFVEKVKNS